MEAAKTGILVKVASRCIGGRTNARCGARVPRLALVVAMLLLSGTQVLCLSDYFLYPQNTPDTVDAWPYLTSFISSRSQSDGKGNLPTGVSALAFIQAGKQYNLNPMILVSLSYNESSWGRDSTGLPFNLFGWTYRVEGDVRTSWGQAFNIDLIRLYQSYFTEGGANYLADRDLGSFWRTYTGLEDSQRLGDYQYVYRSCSPEPSSLLALASGLAGLGGLVCRRRKR